jgi:hypothetical protein
LFTVIIVLLIPEMYVKKITGLRAFLNIKFKLGLIRFKIMLPNN